jgi:hypothetical protein
MARRWWRLAVWATLGCATVTACGSSYAEDTPPPDAASDAAVEGGTGDDAAVADAIPPDAAACDPGKPFGAPVKMADLSSDAQDYSLAFTADERTVILSSLRLDGAQRLFFASRARTEDPFPPPEQLAISDAGAASAPALTPDGHVLFLTMPSAEAGLDLFSTTRLPTPAIAYDVPVALAELNSDANDLAPAISTDGDEIFFMSARSGQQAIYRSTRTATGMFRPPVLVSEIFLDGGREISPVLSADGTTLYFAADTPSGLGALDVWVATRPSRVDPFAAPHPVPQVSSVASDQPVWLSADGCRLYVASGRGGGGFDFFVATKPR